MPELQRPTVVVRRSFLQAVEEFRAEGRGDHRNDTMLDAEIREHGRRWHSDDGFADYVSALRAQSHEDGATREGWVPCTTYWWVEEGEFLGRIALRHRLTESLRKVGGHVGYDVRPTARRRGHASRMLAAVLVRARELGISSALLTCGTENVGSRRVIEANGGRLEDEYEGNLRFWVPTDPVGPLSVDR